jgi:hypothetical protein
MRALSPLCTPTESMLDLPPSSITADDLSRMRNVPAFDVCRSRRSIMPVQDVGEVDVMGIEDLVTAKKTRRDKDWPVVTRLVDVHYRNFADEPIERRVAFWLRELRSPEMLVDLVRRTPDTAQAVADVRPAVARALDLARGQGSHAAIRLAVRDEEEIERAADEAYWAPLLKERASMRRERPRGRTNN